MYRLSAFNELHIFYFSVDGHSEIQLMTQSAMAVIYPRCDEAEELRRQWNKDITLTLGNTLKQYQIPIEHCLQKWNIFYELMVSVTS